MSFQCHSYPGCKNGDCRRPWVIKSHKKLSFDENICCFVSQQECNCHRGWGGFLCDEELNYCDLNPDTCQNGGKCISLTKEDGYFSCDCPTGYRGERCDRTNMTLTSISHVEIITPLPMTQTSSQKPLLSERNTTTAIAISTTEQTTTTTTIESTQQKQQQQNENEA